jgi:hypothetical protein
MTFAPEGLVLGAAYGRAVAPAVLGNIKRAAKAWRDGERTPDGGLLMTATKERLDPANAEHAQRARILAETMIKQTGHRPVAGARSEMLLTSSAAFSAKRTCHRA